MSVLGFVASPVFADEHNVKHHDKHGMKKHHKAMAHHASEHDYKDMGSMPAQPAPVDVCTISPTSMTMDQMTQNAGRALPNPCNPGWFNRIAISGGMNIDLGKWGERDFDYSGVNYKRLSINDAYLNISGTVNEWTKAFVAINYADPSASYVPSAESNEIDLEQAFVTFANFETTPVFVQVGKFYQDFGRYELYPITKSMTQVLSESLDAAGKVGFIYNGFNGSVAVFDAPNKVGHTATETNYVGAIGYDMPGEQFGWGVGGAYMYNFAGTDYIRQALGTTNQYTKRIGGYALYGNVNSGPFSMNVNFTSAADDFDMADVAYTKHGAVHGAKPSAAGIQGGYNFNAMDKNQNIYLGYQMSREAVALNIPKSRWLAGWNVDVWKNTTLGAEFDHDNDYSRTDGGTGRTGHLVSLRAAVKFS